MSLKQNLTMFLWFVQLTIFAQYYPSKELVWEHKLPEEVDLSVEGIKKAVDYAIANETSDSKDLRVALLEGFQHEPYHEILGPTKSRGATAGCRKRKYILCSWIWG